ncbi:MAG: hypothetical protein FJ295_06635 [Planctomycetes bacterium]|nr:hypothetical protein [Planctomycetota bacterium]
MTTHFRWIVFALVAAALVAGCDSSRSPVSNAPKVKPTVGDERTGSSVAAADADRTPTTSPEVERTADSVPLAPATEPLDGYVLIAPLRSRETYLLNNDRQIVHRWTSNYPPGASVYLLKNGDLLRCGRDPDYKKFQAGGVGGIVERFSWDGELLWSFRHQSDDYCSHHDIQPLPNGNLLMIAWERKSNEDAIAQGRDPKLLKDDLWPDYVIEVQPEGSQGGKIVWEWHMWDHLVQDFDREKPNFGVIYEHPEWIDLNNTGSTPPATPEELRKLRAVGYAGGGDDTQHGGNRQRADWMHTNAINYNPDLDQIALSAKNFSELWIIDHSTTTQEAASHRGGGRGKGGDLLYRWGNPWAYKSGTIEDKKLFDQHDVRWIPKRLPGAGRMTIFNNGQGRQFSSVVEIALPLDRNGDYVLGEDGRFGPQELAWEYAAENKKEFYSSFISGATRLANGNTMICEGATGRFFEVNTRGETLWQLVNPYGGELDMDGHPNDVQQEARKLLSGEKQPFVSNNALFRATKFAKDYPGFQGRTLEPLSEQPVPFSQLVNEALEKVKAEEASKPAAESKPGEEP